MLNYNVKIANRLVIGDEPSSGPVKDQFITLMNKYSVSEIFILLN